MNVFTTFLNGVLLACLLLCVHLDSEALAVWSELLESKDRAKLINAKACNVILRILQEHEDYDQFDAIVTKIMNIGEPGSSSGGSSGDSITSAVNPSSLIVNDEGGDEAKEEEEGVFHVHPDAYTIILLMNKARKEGEKNCVYHLFLSFVSSSH